MIPLARRVARIEAAAVPARDPFQMEFAEVSVLLAAEVEPVLVEDYGCPPGAGARFVASQIVQREIMDRPGYEPSSAQLNSMFRRFSILDREGEGA